MAKECAVGEWGDQYRTASLRPDSVKEPKCFSVTRVTSCVRMSKTGSIEPRHTRGHLEMEGRMRPSYAAQGIIGLNSITLVSLIIRVSCARVIRPCVSYVEGRVSPSSILGVLSSGRRSCGRISLVVSPLAFKAASRWLISSNVI
jgi:hypothetical protein